MPINTNRYYSWNYKHLIVNSSTSSRERVTSRFFNHQWHSPGASPKTYNLTPEPLNICGLYWCSCHSDVPRYQPSEEALPGEGAERKSYVTAWHAHGTKVIRISSQSSSMYYFPFPGEEENDEGKCRFWMMFFRGQCPIVIAWTRPIRGLAKKRMAVCTKRGENHLWFYFVTAVIRWKW